MSAARRVFIGNVILTSFVSVGFCARADAQDGAAAPSSVRGLEEVVVTGIRAQNLKAIDAKREGDAILDAVAADEIGSLPDFNIGETLQRLPGVNIVNDQAEARFVTIRGLNASYNYTTVDGSSIAVPDQDGRRVFMDVMPASFAERIEVLKTLTPDQEGSAIGGVINIVSPSAFDPGRSTFSAQAEIGKYENDAGYRGSRPSGDASFIYSTRFGSADQFGAILTGNFYNRVSYIPQVEFGSSNHFYAADGSFQSSTDPLAGNALAVPKERRWYWYYNDRKRFGGSAKFEYKPDEDRYYWFKAFANTATDDENRQTDLLASSGSNTVVSNQTSTSGRVSALNGRALVYQDYLGQFEFTREVWGAQMGADHNIGDHGRLEVKGTYSGSYFNNPENWSEWRNKTAADLAFDYQRIGSQYSFEFVDPAAAYDPRAFVAERRQFDERQMREDIYEAQIDYGHNVENGDIGFGWKIGAKYREDSRDFNEDRRRYRPTGSNDYTLAAADALATRWRMGPPGAGSGQSILVIDPARAVESFDAHLAANPNQWSFDEMVGDDNRLDYSLTENVWAAYAMLVHASDRHRIIAGARYEDTGLEAGGRRNVDGAWGPSNVRNDYGNWLPSVNASYWLTDDVVLRAAFSQAIGRAPFNETAPVGESFNPDTRVMSRANPDLRPRESNNYDLSAEWYFDGGSGILSVGLFHKNVTNEFVTLQSREQIQIDGEMLTVDVTQTTNSAKANKISGVELGFVKDLTFLPQPFDGFGISANVTLLDTGFTVTDSDGSAFELRTGEGQADKAYNLALYYEKGPISAKFAYNYQGLKLSRFINTSTPYRNRYDTPEKQLDFKASYQFTESFAATFNAWNLTDEGRGEVFGLHQELPVVSADFGRAFFGGFTIQF